MGKWKRVRKRKKIGVGEQKQEEKDIEHGVEPKSKEEGVAEIKGTRHSFTYPTVRKYAGTTYSPKHSPKLKLRG